MRTQSNRRFASGSELRSAFSLQAIACVFAVASCGTDSTSDGGDLVPPGDTTPPTTTASPAGGTYSAAQSVVLTCDDGTGSGCSATYYTTDGSVPTAASTAYAAPILVSSDTALRFFSADAAGNSETVKTETYVVNDALAPSAPIVSGSTPTNDATPEWTWTSGGGGNGTYRLELDDADLTSGAAETTATVFVPAAAFADGETHTLYVQERDDVGNWSASGSFAIAVDTAPPSAPVVVGTTPTSDTTPAWSWASGGGGNGTYRYELDDADLASGATTTTATTYVPGAAFAHGEMHTLYVQERDDVGNWSAPGSFAIAVDTVPPSAPVVSGTTPTNDTTPQWTWISGGEGNGTYRYELDDVDLTTGAAETTATVFMPAAAFAHGETHTLYVQERDDAGNWSDAGSFAIAVDALPPSAPVVSGTTPTSDTTPAWSWTPGGGGSGTYRYKLDDANLTSGATVNTATAYVPGTAFADGETHTLYVQERDAAGNWSATGSFAIVIDTSRPDAPMIMSPVDGSATNDAEPVVSGIAEDDSTVELFDTDGTLLGTVTAADGVWSLSVTLALGEHSLTATATDTAGNASDASAPLRIRIGTHIYVADSANDRVVRIEDMAGTDWTTFGTAGTGSGQFGTLNGMCVGKDGKIYVADRTNHRITRMDDMSGTGWTTLGSFGTGANQFNFPDSVFADDNGKIYVADTSNHRIVRVNDMAGTGWTTFGANGTGTNQFNYPDGILVLSTGEIYVVDRNNDRIVRIDDMTGTGWTTFGSSGAAVNQFGSACGIAVDSFERIYVTDGSNNRVARFDDMAGTNWVTFGSAGSGTNQLSAPDGISIDWAGKIYISDRNNDRIVRIDDMTGAGWTTFGSTGSGTNEIDSPYAVFYR